MENPSHCDFVKLRTMLVRTHMQDLKDVTRETHYENYRTQCIQSMTRMVVKERNRKYGLGWAGPGRGAPLFGGTPHTARGGVGGAGLCEGPCQEPWSCAGEPQCGEGPLLCPGARSAWEGDAPAVRGPCIPPGWVCLSWNTPAVRGTL